MNLPHDYTVTAQSQPESLVSLKATGLPDMQSEPPTEFGGSGEDWSPEDFLVRAVADCFVLSFKAIATQEKLSKPLLKKIILKCLGQVNYY